ncbi:MAG: PAS domain-containing protein, partial [Caldimonas sp.]
MPNAAPAPEQLSFVDIDFVAGQVRTSASFTAVTGCAAAPAEGLAIDEARTRGLSAIVAGDRARVEQALSALLRRPATTHLRFDAIGDDGRQRSIESVWSIETGADGRPRRAVVTCLDCGARTQADRTLRESEARYRSALQAGRIGTWETDLVAGTRTWSPEGMDLFGLALEGGRGHVGGDADEYRAALLPEDRHLMAHFHELADTLDSFAAEYRIVRPDGKTLWLSGRGLVVARQPSGKAHRLVSIMADVTERRETEDVLRVERERLSLALEAGQMGVFDYDLANDALWWSRQMYDVFGVAPESFRPTRQSVTELLHPDSREAFMRERAVSIATRRPLQLEFRALRPDGEIAWISHRGRTEYDAQGQPVRTFGVSIDITQLKRAEETLREADRKKDHFIATLAHELRNPLAPIRNAIGVLRRQASGDEQTAWCRDVIDRQVGQMARLLDDLLDVSRISGGRLQLRREPVLLAALFAQAVEIGQPLIDAAGHALAVTLP